MPKNKKVESALKLLNKHAPEPITVSEKKSTINLTNEKKNLDELFQEFYKNYSKLTKILPSDRTLIIEVVPQKASFNEIVNYLGALHDKRTKIRKTINENLQKEIDKIKENQANTEENIKKLESNEKRFHAAYTEKITDSTQWKTYTEEEKNKIQTQKNTIADQYRQNKKDLKKQDEEQKERLSLFNKEFEYYSQKNTTLQEDFALYQKLFQEKEANAPYDLTRFDLSGISPKLDPSYTYRITWKQLKELGERGSQFKYDIQCSNLFDYDSKEHFKIQIKKRFEIQKYFSPLEDYCYFLLIHANNWQNRTQIRMPLSLELKTHVFNLLNSLEDPNQNTIKTVCLDEKSVVNALIALIGAKETTLFLIEFYGLIKALKMLSETYGFMPLEVLQEIHDTINPSLESLHLAFALEERMQIPFILSFLNGSLTTTLSLITINAIATILLYRDNYVKNTGTLSGMITNDFFSAFLFGQVSFVFFISENFLRRQNKQKNRPAIEQARKLFNLDPFFKSHLNNNLFLDKAKIIWPEISIEVSKLTTAIGKQKQGITIDASAPNTHTDLMERLDYEDIFKKNPEYHYYISFKRLCYLSHKLKNPCFNEQTRCPDLFLSSSKERIEIAQYFSSPSAFLSFLFYNFDGDKKPKAFLTFNIQDPQDSKDLLNFLKSLAKEHGIEKLLKWNKKDKQKIIRNLTAVMTPTTLFLVLFNSETLPEALKIIIEYCTYLPKEALKEILATSQDLTRRLEIFDQSKDSIISLVMTVIKECILHTKLFRIGGIPFIFLPLAQFCFYMINDYFSFTVPESITVSNLLIMTPITIISFAIEINQRLSVVIKLFDQDYWRQFLLMGLDAASDAVKEQKEHCFIQDDHKLINHETFFKHAKNLTNELQVNIDHLDVIDVFQNSSQRTEPITLAIKGK